jgi:DNA-binding NarL/FixJ family response regulator
MSMFVKLAMVDEGTLFIKILRSYLSGQFNIQVTLHAVNFSSLVEKDFDILLINLLRQENTVSMLRQLRQAREPVRTLVLAPAEDLCLISELLDLGVYGVVSANDDPEELLRAITTIAAGDMYRNRLVTDALYWRRQQEQDLELSVREQKVLQLLWEEKSNKEIAQELFLSVRSVEKIRQDLKDKLDIKSTVGLLKYGVYKKIIAI